MASFMTRLDRDQAELLVLVMYLARNDLRHNLNLFLRTREGGGECRGGGRFDLPLLRLPALAHRGSRPTTRARAGGRDLFLRGGARQAAHDARRDEDQELAAVLADVARPE